MPMATREEQRAYQRQWMLDRRWQGIQYLGGRCAHCGSAEDLEIDHIDPAAKSLPTGNIWSRRWEVIYEELDKCQVLCHECHLEKSRAEGAFHGPYGAANGSSKLTAGDAVEIRALVAEGYLQREVADWFGVSRAAVSDIWTGRTWGHTTGRGAA